MDHAVASRLESSRILSQRYTERHEVKKGMLNERKSFEKKVRNNRVTKEYQWQKKMERSPFLVDLVAENERIEEDIRVRLKEESRREKRLDVGKMKVMNEIVLKALAETNDLEALRQEKRLIANEEKRLKALIDLERAKTHKKQNMVDAQRAEKQRKSMQAKARRKEVLEQRLAERRYEEELLREKLDLPPAGEDQKVFTYLSTL